MATEWSTLDDMIAEAREMQHAGKYINGRIFHALVDEITWLREELCLSIVRCRHDMGFDNEHGPIGCRLDGVGGASCRCRAIGSLSSSGKSEFFSDWIALDPTALPDPKQGPFLTTNNPEGRNSAASGRRPSHVWLVSMFHATTDADGPVMAFDSGGYTKLWGLKLYKPVFARAAIAKATTP